jgi:hypothetical protein
MQSKLDPRIIYEDIGGGITETDINVVSDLWEMDGREVYRGSRDPRYTHANVYWLYEETLERVGLAEHSLEDHAVFHLLWFNFSEFGTFLQEDWKSFDDIWSILPRRVFDRCIEKEWTTPNPFLDQCLSGPTRIITPKMLRSLPTVYTCTVCNQKSINPIPGCKTETSALDFPDVKRLVFVDDDMIVHVPPPNSSVWSLLGITQVLPVGDSLQEVPQEV